MDERVVVVGAGPAGLAAAWATGRAGLDPLVVDQADSAAASWRDRHDHLRLNTHRMFSHQPGARIPRRCGPFPARDDYVTYLQDYAAGMRLRLGTRVHRVDRAGADWELRLDGGSLRAAQVVIATGPDAEPFMPGWPGMDGFSGIMLHAGQFRNVAAMAGLDVLVVGPGNSGVDLLGHLARSGAGRLWLSPRSGMTITPLRLGGVPLHPVSVAGRYLPRRWQDANARAVQRLAFGDLARLGYPRPAVGPLTRHAADGVTVAVDAGLVRALKAGSTAPRPASPTAPAAPRMRSSARPVTAPNWNRSPGTWSGWTPAAFRPSPAPAPHRPSPAYGSSAWTAASTATCTSAGARHAS